MKEAETGNCFSSEFIRGQLDCRAGVKHKPGQSEDYDRAFSIEYESEQIKDKLTEWGIR